MKKILALILAAIMAFSLAACSELESIELPALPEPESSSEPEKDEKEAAEDEIIVMDEEEPAEAEAVSKTAGDSIPAQKVENPIIIRNEKTVYEELDPAESKEVILTFAYDSPKVYIEGRDEAGMKINEYLGLVDEAFYTGADYGVGECSIGTGYDIMLESALDNFSYHYNNNGGEDPVGLEFSCTRNYEVKRADTGLISLLYHSGTYMGGAHGNSSDCAYVFDAESGERVSIDALSSDFDAFTAFLVEKMVTMAESQDYYKERISMVEPEAYSQAFGDMLLRDGSWYFDNEGMVIFANPDVLGPHAAGIIEFKIPYTELSGKIQDKFIPGERQGMGSFTLKAMSEVKDGTVEIIDKLSVQPEGQELCLIAEGNVYDVRLVSVSYADQFYELENLFYASEMGDSAVQLVTVIPEGVPDLLLKYNTADGEEHRFLISQSGKDGSFILIADDIEAVG